MIEWQIATVEGIRQETSSVKTLTLTLPTDTASFRPGQHYDLRLIAEDGYEAQRSYSISSAPGSDGYIELTVERLEDGEVSPYLHDILRPGDQIEVRGPIGGYFVWDESVAAGMPLLLVAGGSGIAPLMSIIRHRASTSFRLPTTLLYSARTHDNVIFLDELEALDADDRTLEAVITLTRSQPEGWAGYSRRIDSEMLTEVADPLGNDARAYVCGPTLMVEAVANGLVEIGLSPRLVLTERFGPTGEI